MNSQTAQPIQDQILRVLLTLPVMRQQELLDFALFLRQRELAQPQCQTWDAVSDEVAAALKAEFAEEDRALAEMMLPDYAAVLTREDEA